ncbi:TPA: ribosomal protein S18-alanine N-acetyltransferase [Streptococcus equi subsp. zooepidemicus]|uniref:ribosomal protein S18-alanine N-acetyltransferase n=1 Tax=Streptococcus equi TaxID=1336 RepID=UPI001E39189B|nr:ribosomal protein S18-alanine N-acetyltransferase [Streptococcus equi]MCD3373164.1 ribosomal protein S18-alanine N-acetyltransferase [Streptococcus equi subsp. zooepidemicus]MDI5952204.1 ribosomal protein S18-alanine N-acetyltransferase [Streptococcus equi subsp. zooepidemicus]MDI6073801.1 ribosomal protein S18-alanine N-acetyltransferase [Streptococcus equi subsp. zooepidemicus]HEK9955783.1 ribosomal protein S18-alanine N-acetyltransferase [Streptococcus equi subsp. zooepidemicus]HEK999452
MMSIQEKAAAVYQVLKEVYGQSPWTLKQIVSDMQQEHADYFTFYHQETLLGFLAIQQLPGEMEITNLAVLPSYQGQGIASWLMGQLDGFEGVIFLEVRASNHRAQQLYLKHGFEVVGQRSNYYHDPIEAALIMRREGKNDR